MAFAVSPSVVVTEKDNTSVVPNVATSVGGAVITAEWGPVLVRTQISTENEFKTRFGLPNDVNAEDWFTVANFLSYTNNILVVRNVNAATLNAGVQGDGTAPSSAILVKNRDHYDTITFTDELALAKYPGAKGNSLKIYVADSGIFSKWKYRNEFERIPGTSNFVSQRGGSNDEMHVIVIDEDGSFTGTANTVLEKFSFVSKASNALTIDGSTNYVLNVLASQSQYVWGGKASEYPTGTGGDHSTTFTAMTSDGGGDKLADITITTPGTGYVVDETFTWSDGTPDVQGTGVITSVGGSGEITGVSLSTYGSGYDSAPTTAVITTSGGSGAALTGVLEDLGLGGSLSGGVSDTTAINDSQRQAGWNLFANAEEVDVDILISGPSSTTTSKWIIDNVADVRRDCVVCVSPVKASVVNNTTNEATSVVSNKNSLTESSYSIMDDNWKYQFDRYNGIERYIPMNGDIGGLLARTDYTADPWFSPAGLNRGQIKNMIKLAWTPTSSNRDTLYQAGVNSVVNFPGQGTVLWGDRTMASLPSAFDRINVRRLFVVLEKAISTAAKFQLFEVNDEFTRNQFISMVEPFLRTVQGRRGITDFRVVCDTSNNTSEVIDRNEFLADIYIKPTRSINFIKLNFIASRTGVNFTEIGG